MICPNCGAIAPSGGFSVERRPDGDTTCAGCNHKGKSSTFFPFDKHDPHAEVVSTNRTTTLEDFNMEGLFADLFDVINKNAPMPPVLVIGILEKVKYEILQGNFTGES